MLIPNTAWERDQKGSFQKRHKPFQTAVDKGVNKGYDFGDFSQDLYSSLYQINPEFPKESTPGAAWAKKALDELRSLPELKQIRESGTKCDSFQSGLGASILTKHFAESLPKAPEEENPDKVQQDITNLEALLEELPKNHPKHDKFTERLSQAKDKQSSSQQVWDKATKDLDSSKIRQAFRKAIAEAQEEIQETEDMANAFGYGTEPGSDGYSNLEAKMAVAEEIRKNEKLKQIARLAGRFRVEARKEQANKKRPGPDEITDVETGNDLGRLLPSELMKLRHPLLKRVFYKGYTERSLMQYKLETVIKESRGPIIFCLDNSGSMMGLPELWSKGICLGIAQVAVDQKRTFQIIHFHSKVARSDIFPAGKVDPMKLLKSISYFSSGGTAFEPPLNKAFKSIEEEAEKDLKKADVIFITDGEAPLGHNTVKKLIKKKQETGASIYTIAIGWSAPSMEPISDEITTIENLAEAGSDTDIRKTLFSI